MPPGVLSWRSLPGAPGERVSVNNLVRLDEALKQYQPEREAPEIKVQFVENYIGIANVVCPHCTKHSRHEITRSPHDEPTPANAPLPPAAAAPADTAAPAAESAKPAKPAETPTIKGYREGVSASDFHAAVLSNNEIPPLKKRQPSHFNSRNVSPVTYGDTDPAPRRDYAPAGSALDELNPTRKVN